MSRLLGRVAVTCLGTALRRCGKEASVFTFVQPRGGDQAYACALYALARFSTEANYPPHTALGMPSLSPTMNQGNIAEWKKSEGDQVAAGDVLCEVETDKATIEWESVEEGYLAKILSPNGTNDIPIGTVVAVLCEEESDIPKFSSYLPVAASSATEAVEASSTPVEAEEVAHKTNQAPALDLPPHTILDMPSLSPTMTQGSLSAWKKKEGDSIEAGEILAEVETDKATIEWEAVDGGYLAKILVGDNTSDIDIGTPVAIVCEDQENLAAFANITSESIASGGSIAPPAAETVAVETPAVTPSAAPAAQPAAATASKSFARKTNHGGHVPASPLAKAIAREAQVDLSLVVGTGPEGRVIAADVREFVESRPSVQEQSAAAFHSQGGADPQAFYEDVEISQMRRVIGQRLLQSKQTIPHYYLSMDCDVGSLMSLRQSVNASITESAKGSKVSLNDFVIKAAALACKAVPECNAEWRDDCIRLHKNVNVGVAMDLGSLGHSQGGLVVPVVRHVHTKGVAAIAKDVKTYASKAKAMEGADGKMRLSLEEMEGGTFTVSNLGMFGVKQFAAIVNPPQSCILAVGTVRSEVKKGDAEGEFQEAKIMNVTLSCDHRVVDGAVGAKWLQEFKSLIENPLQMLI